MYGKYNSILSNISVTENQTKIISQRDINAQNFVQTLRSQIYWKIKFKNFGENAISFMITYQIIQHFQSDFHTFITFHVSFRLW